MSEIIRLVICKKLSDNMILDGHNTITKRNYTKNREDTDSQNREDTDSREQPRNMSENRDDKKSHLRQVPKMAYFRFKTRRRSSEGRCTGHTDPELTEHSFIDFGKDDRGMCLTAAQIG